MFLSYNFFIQKICNKIIIPFSISYKKRHFENNAKKHLHGCAISNSQIKIVFLNMQANPKLQNSNAPAKQYKENAKAEIRKSPSKPKPNLPGHQSAHSKPKQSASTVIPI